VLRHNGEAATVTLSDVSLASPRQSSIVRGVTTDHELEEDCGRQLLVRRSVDLVGASRTAKLCCQWRHFARPKGRVVLSVTSTASAIVNRHRAGLTSTEKSPLELHG